MGHGVRMSIAVLALSFAGCGPSPLIRRASVEMGCPTTSLDARRIGAGGYVVAGCGQERIYTCSGSICIPSTETSGGGTTVASPRPSASGSGAATQWSNDSVRTMLGAIHDDVLACFAAEHVPASVRIVIGRTGHVTDQSMVSEASGEELTCAARVLQRVALEGAPRAPRTVVLAFAPRSQEIVPSTADGVGAPDVIDVETDVRAQIDAHASTVLVCTDGASVAVALSWDPRGVVAVALRGRMHGTAEEACVQHTLADVHIASAGAAGSVLHPVEAATESASSAAALTRPGRTDVVEAMNAVSRSIEACGDGRGGAVSVALEIASDGAPRSVEVIAPDPTAPVVSRDVRGTPIETCVVAALRTVRLPAFTAPTFRFSYQVHVR